MPILGDVSRSSDIARALKSPKGDMATETLL
jgi:hypothetical protein